MGYVGNRKSVRAVHAEKEGRYPKSRFTKEMILKGLKSLGVTEEQLSIISSESLSVLRDYFLKSFGEWHHTGKYFRQTDYYEVYFEPESFDIDKFKNFAKRHKENKAKEIKQKQEEQGKKARCKYLIWSRANKNSKIRPKEYESIGLIKGRWFYLDDGTKKSIYANGFEILEYL